jgi:hypothetical protein
MAPGGSVGATVEETVFTCAYTGKYFKNLLLKNQLVRKAEIYMKAFRHSTKASLLKWWLPGVGRGHNRGNCTCVYMGKEYLKKNSSREPMVQKS